MDTLDREIIQLLQVNGRLNNAEIARAISVSEGTVRRRLKRLRDDSVIKVVAVPDVEKMGNSVTAMIGIRADPSRVNEVADALTNLKQVHYVAITTGSRDVYAWIAASSTEDLGRLLRTEIGAIPGIKRIETFVNLAIQKRSHGLIL